MTDKTNDVNKKTDMTTASIIIEQLGGGSRFVLMTGATNFITNGNDLTFSLPGSGGFCKNGINRVNIELTPADTYTVKFYRLRGSKLTLVATHTDIYFDMLLDCISNETGLAVRMPKVTFK